MVYSIDIHHLLWGICILRNILGSPSNRCLKMDPAIINQWIPVDISGYQWIKGDIQPQNWRFPEISPCLAASSVGLSHHDSTGEIPMSHHVSVKSHWFHCVLSLCFTYLYISLPIFFPMKLPVSSIVIRPKPWVFFPRKVPPWRPRTTSGISIISCARATNSKASFTSWVYKPPWKIRWGFSLMFPMTDPNGAAICLVLHGSHPQKNPLC